jgi:purine-binding chemotaxis protein CheW
MEVKKSESYLLFRLQEELFAVSVHQVLEIIETGEEHTITHLPKAPSCVNGVVNFRGNVIPVVNTRLKFDLEDYTNSEKFVVMVLSLQMNNQEMYVGAMSDKVVDVIEISEENIKPVPEVGKGYNANYIKGVLHREGRFIMLLNIDAAIGSDEIIKLKDENFQGVATETSEASEINE